MILFVNKYRYKYSKCFLRFIFYKKEERKQNNSHYFNLTYPTTTVISSDFPPTNFSFAFLALIAKGESYNHVKEYFFASLAI